VFEFKLLFIVIAFLYAHPSSHPPISLFGEFLILALIAILRGGVTAGKLIKNDTVVSFPALEHITVPDTTGETQPLEPPQSHLYEPSVNPGNPAFASEV
jgi:hypothetical protein